MTGATKADTRTLDYSSCSNFQKEGDTNIDPQIVQS